MPIIKLPKLRTTALTHFRGPRGTFLNLNGSTEQKETDSQALEMVPTLFQVDSLCLFL